jgi:hypothetical protein
MQYIFQSIKNMKTNNKMKEIVERQPTNKEKID